MKFLVLLLTITAIQAQNEPEKSVLCSKDYCKNKQTSDDPLVCETISKKCKEQGKGLYLPSPVTCNCCEYCVEYLEKDEDCSVGSQTGLTAKAICGPGLYCEPTTSKCVKYEDVTDDSKLSTCVKAQRDFEKRKRDGTLGYLEQAPYCDDHGEYEPYQCIPGQICYCVDKDGTRIFGESDFSSTPQFYLRCACSRAYRIAENLLGRKIQPGEHFRCAANGDFESLQCIDDKCLCVDTHDGSPSYPDDKLVNITDLTPQKLPCLSQKQIEPETKLTEYYKKCEWEYLYLKNQVDDYKKQGYDIVFSYKFPNCDLNGGYSLVQIDDENKIKYCSYPNGTIIGDYKGDVTDTKMDCKCAKANSVATTDEKPVCLYNGNYQPLQCRRDKCYCVDNDGRQNVKEVYEHQQKSLPCYGK